MLTPPRAGCRTCFHHLPYFPVSLVGQPLHRVRLTTSRRTVVRLLPSTRSMAPVPLLASSEVARRGKPLYPEWAFASTDSTQTSDAPDR